MTSSLLRGLPAACKSRELTAQTSAIRATAISFQLKRYLTLFTRVNTYLDVGRLLPLHRVQRARDGCMVTGGKTRLTNKVVVNPRLGNTVGHIRCYGSAHCWGTRTHELRDLPAAATSTAAQLYRARRLFFNRAWRSLRGFRFGFEMAKVTGPTRLTVQ